MSRLFQYRPNPEILLAIPDDLATRRWLRTRILETADKALQRLGPSMISDAKMLREFRDIFDASLDALTGKIDAENRDRSGIQEWLRLRGGKGTWASGAIEAAFNIGLFYGEGELPGHVRAEYERNRTKPANKARRRADIQAIVEKHATACWVRKRSFIGKAHRTAKEIRSAVAAEIRETYGDNPPTGWKPTQVGDDDSAVMKAAQKEIERIAKRIGRMCQADK